MMRTPVCWVASALLAVLPAHAAVNSGPHGGEVDQSAALSLSQSAIGAMVGSHRFVDRRGRTLELDELRGKPLVVSLIYTSCAHTCPMLTSHLANTVKIAREALGDDSFRVLTLGFDTPVDTPVRMASFARERAIDLPGWYFASADAATIDAFSRELGFVFFPSAAGFDHLAQTTVLDADGRVYTQVYGQSFDPPSLVEPLKQLVFGTHADARSLSGWVSGVRLFCTVYDPASGRYRFDYSIFIALGVGLLCLGAVAVFIVRAWRERSAPTSAV
jgi:protein SCO1/2